MSTKRLIASTVGAQAVRTGLTVISGPILARLLGPIPYGVLTPAQSAGSMGRLLAESGFAYHTVTSPELSQAEAKDLHWQSVRLSLAISLVAAIFAAVIGGVPPWQRLLRAAVAFCLVVLTGANAVPYAWNQRIGQLGRIEWLGVLCQAIATFVVAVPMAMAGWGVVSAATNQLLPILLGAGVAWYIAGMWRVRRQPAHVERSYRIGALFMNITTYLAINVDLLTLSTYLSLVPLGIYSRANVLSGLPGVMVTVTTQKVGLASLSKSKNWSSQRRFLIKASLLTLVAYLSVGLLPICGIDLMGFVFGGKFAVTPKAFGLLIGSQTLFSLGSILDTQLTAQRRLTPIAISHFAQAVASFTAFMVFHPTEISQIALVLLIPAGVRYVYMIAVVLRAAGTVNVEPPAPAEAPDLATFEAETNA